MNTKDDWLWGGCHIHFLAVEWNTQDGWPWQKPISTVRWESDAEDVDRDPYFHCGWSRDTRDDWPNKPFTVRWSQDTRDDWSAISLQVKSDTRDRLIWQTLFPLYGGVEPRDNWSPSKPCFHCTVGRTLEDDWSANPVLPLYGGVNEH